ncbi:regulating synaptic membrane exocytosis protein 1 isoform X2 [Photinus pyralis]|nr:regulating synaptic membrane exocytosis protein 1 isoform X2 [Photinus pyralis]XP_031346560.1 regulating synaptic membrane exocytosis protein 1 isoform X2 [Photinus pyralis]
MVTAEPTDGGTATDGGDSGTTFGKLKQTLSSSLLTAQDKVTKISPRPTVNQEPEPPPPSAEEKPPTPATTEPAKPPSRMGACRVCLKAFKPDEFNRTCSECTQRVCEDCASYSKKPDDEEPDDWKCSVCRRKLQSRPQIAQDSTESLLDIPVQELQRRHSEARLGGGGGLSATLSGGGLAPPRSPELRRHSDVSPASLKELEKLKGGNNKGATEQDWSRGNRGARSAVNSRSNSPPREATRSRRASRVTRQHSYGEDVKPTAKKESEDAGLSLPTPMPRRASAYDVFSAPGANNVPSPALGRKASFRAIVPDPVSPQSPDVGPTSLVTPEEDRRMRRRGSQLPEISGLRPLVTPRPTPALEDLEAIPRRQASIDAEAIRIVIHDVDSTPGPAAQKRVILRRDPTDKAHRTRGFGMRVVGGKTGLDGRLFAYIVWTVPGGPAEKGGLQQGDRVLEWGGISLIDRSFEEVCAIMDRTGDMVELLVEHASDLRMCDILDDPIPPNVNMARKLSDVGSGLYVDADAGGPSSPTRRKLPKTPEQLAKERQVSGRVQIQVWYHDERRELVVAVLAADDLAPRDESLGYGSQPEAYARLCLMPLTDDQHCVQTEVAPASQNPIWNANLSFPGVPGDELMERTLDVTLWDLIPQNEQTFLGECCVDLQKAFLDDRAVWCRLEDPRQMRGKSPHNSPRGSIAGLCRRNDFISQRSASDDLDSIGECASLLHPDHAWGSRRGSSQSEQLEVEVYQLGKDFSKSLPGSRRSSFQSGQDPAEADLPAVPPPSSYSRDRRRSSCTRMLRDPEEILRSLKAVKGELGRTMSFSGDKKHRRSTSGPSGRESRENSIVPEVLETTKESPPSSPERTSPPRLGPGQVKPRGFRLSSTKPVELKLGLQMTKGQLEVEVLCARHIPSKVAPPDTYVKCYLRDGERWLQKKKTRVVKHTCEPHFKQTLKYQACDVLGRSLVVMLWERQGGFEHNLGLGGAEVALDLLTLTSITTGWYPLFPIHSLGSDSNDSP